MTDHWHRTQALVGLPGMAGERSIQLHGARRGWQSREVKWGARTRLEWRESSLPAETQAALRQARGEVTVPCSHSETAADGGTASLESGRPSSAVSLPCEKPAAKVDARLEIVTAFDRWHARRGGPLVPALKAWVALYAETGAGVSDEARALIPTIAWNTLQRHRHAFLKEGSRALLPGAGGRTSVIEAEPDLRDYVEALIRANPHHITAKNIRRAVAAKWPDRAPPSIHSIRRFRRAWQSRHAFALSADAPDAHRSRTMPAFGDAAAEVTALNELWELDSTRVDVMCADGRRHAIVAAIDVWSRRAKVLVTPQSHAVAIAALIRNCILDWGVPDWVSTDEGADYTSRHLKRVVADLGIGHQILPPYSPDKKPFIERFIGTLSRDFLTQLPGFAGHNVAQAQRLRDRRSFAARRGEDRTVTFRSELTAEALQGLIDAWCETLYEREPHGGLDGVSPFAKAASWTGPRRRADERGLDVLLAPAAGDGRRKVGKNGIRVDGGLYIAAELGHHMGEWVHVRQDPADYGRIYVFTEPDGGGGHFLCIAEDPLRTGIDRQQVASAARKNWRTTTNRSRARTRELAREHRPAEAIDAVLDHAAGEAERVVSLPRRGEAHSTGAMNEAAKASAAADAIDEAEAEARAGRPTSTVAIFQRFYQGE